jgi:hypothetical protein
MIATLPVGSSVMMLSESCCPLGLFWIFFDSNKGATMSHPVPTPLLSGENLLTDDNDIILLTDEIPPSDDDIIELYELDDRSDIQEIIKFPDSENDKTDFIDLCDVLEEPDNKPDHKPEHLPYLSGTDAETLNLSFDQLFDPFLLEPKVPVEDTDTVDFLQSNDLENVNYLAENKDFDTDNDLILLQDIVPLTLDNEFVESLGPSVEPAQTSTLSTEKDAAIYEDMMAFQPMDQIEAVMERVIRNLFAERIGHILDEVVTTTVTKEIENLKKIILDYLASGQSAP